MEKERIVWLDWMRVTACFMVMVVHSTEPFYLGDGGLKILTESDAWWVGLTEGLVRMCVPLFTIASSYLLFPVRQDTVPFLRRRFIRVIVPLAAWSLFYAFYWGDTQSLKDLVWNFNYAAGHLWYVYMILGIYLLMPLLSPWAEKVSKRELSMYLFLCFFTSIIPLLRDYLSGGQTILELGPTGIPSRALYPLWGEASWNPYGMFYYFSGFIGYLLLGLYFRRFSPVRGWGRTLLIAIPCLTAGFAISFCGFMRRAYIVGGGEFPLIGGLDKAVWLETPLVNDTIAVALMTIGWVLVMRKMFSGKKQGTQNIQSPTFRRVILPISKASYGMYLMHMVVLAAVSGLLRELLGIADEAIWGMWTTPVQIICTATASFVIVSIAAILLQRIPKIGKYIMG